MITDTQKEALRKDLHESCGIYMYGSEIDKLLAIVNRHAPKAFSKSVIENNSPRTPNDVTEEAIQRATDHANEAWKQGYMEAVEEVCKTKETFTPDDVMEVMFRRHPELSTHDNRASGGIMVSAARRGLCEKTDKVLSSQNPKHHKMRKTIWRSRIYR